MGRRPASSRWGSDGAILAPRTALAVALRRHPELVSRYCTPVACDVRTRALLYDVDEADRVLSTVGRWSPRRLKKLDSCERLQPSSTFPGKPTLP